MSVIVSIENPDISMRRATILSEIKSSENLTKSFVLVWNKLSKLIDWIVGSDWYKLEITGEINLAKILSIRNSCSQNIRTESSSFSNLFGVIFLRPY